LAKALLTGQTVFIPGAKKGWGNLYKLAANNDKSAHTKKTILNDEVGTLIWFDDKPA
jgi:hypothetical protein